MLDISDWHLGSWSSFGYDHWSLIKCWFKFWLSTLTLKVQRTYMCFKSWFGALVDSGCYWRGFSILILIWIWSLGFDTLMIQSWHFYFDFEGAKKLHVLQVLILDFGGCWRFLTGVWDHVPDLDMVTYLWWTYVPNFGSLFWFWKCREHPCPQSPDLGLWKMLEAPEWGLASWSWFGYCHWSLKVQRTSMSFKSSFGALEDAWSEKNKLWNS